MRKNCADALKRWQQGIESPPSVQGSSIWTDGDLIWSYGTVILSPTSGDALVLNRTRYSITTTIHQNALAVALRFDEVHELDGIPMGPSASLRATQAQILERGI